MNKLRNKRTQPLTKKEFLLKKDFLDVNDIQDLLSCSRLTAYKYMDEMQEYQIGKRRLVETPDFEKWLKSKKREKIKEVDR